MDKQISAFASEVHEMFMQDLLECFEEVFVDLARESMKQSIKHNVYSKYRPGAYVRRRENGGLIADENIFVEVYRDKTTGNIIGYVKNITEGVGNAYELDEVIESGIGYDWEDSKIFNLQPFPRPFYDDTIVRIEKANWLWKVRKKMQERGWRAVGK